MRCALSRSSRPLRGSCRPTNRTLGVPSCQRAIGHGVGEPGHVDAVGDHLVVAREEPVDEMPGGGAHGDPAVEARGVSAQGPAAELVRRREAGVGMERGDVDARRLAQEEQRQERDERLVEVEDVELLALEHRADLAEVARRERERADRGVDGHREAHPEPDDVALRRPLRAVARGQDADVVAALAEALVEEVDVLGDAAAGRIDVRADQADLHARSPRRAASSGSKRGGRARPPG